MTILVTGCMGFIGSNLVPKLLNIGYKVLGFDNLSHPSLEPADRIKKESGKNWQNFVFYKCDITDIEMMGSILANNKVDYIVHLAAMGSVPKSFEQPSNFIKTNIEGTSNVFLLASHFKIRKIIFASSSSVYGDLDPTQDKHEYKKGNSLSPYAFTKQASEDFARIWSEKTGLKYIGLRFFNVYGPGQRNDSEYSAVIPKFISEKEQISINGDGSNIRDFTYVDDVCKAIQSAIITSNNNQIYNVGTGQGTSIKSLADKLCQSKKIIYEKERSSDVKKSIAETTKASLGLAFKAETDIDQGLEKTRAYYEMRNICDNAQ